MPSLCASSSLYTQDSTTYLFTIRDKLHHPDCSQFIFLSIFLSQVDFFQLQMNTLRRYKRHYKLQLKPGTNKIQLVEVSASYADTTGLDIFCIITFVAASGIANIFFANSVKYCINLCMSSFRSEIMPYYMRVKLSA